MRLRSFTVGFVAVVIYLVLLRVSTALPSAPVPVGVAAQLVGVTRKTINIIERGVFVPSTVLALEFAQAFGVPVEEVFSLADP